MTTRTVIFGLYIAWDFTNYVAESARLISASGEMSYVPPGDGFSSGRGIISSMNLTLRNDDARYSALNEDSAIYAYIQNGKAYHAPCYLTVSVDGGLTNPRIFTGVIKWPEIIGATATAGSRAQIECRSNEEKLLQTRMSTTLEDFAGYHDTGYDEGSLITAWLTDAGISGGSMEIDTGLLNIPWAWLDDESPIEEIWKLAAACGGRFYANPDGKFVYESATYWLTNSESLAIQESLDESNYTLLEPVYDDRDLFDSVLVEAAPREALSPDYLWTPDEIVRVLPGETKVITARLRQPAYEIDDVTFTARTAGGTNITASVDVSAVNYAQRVVVTITNNHATHTAYMRPLSITGRTVSGSITVEEERNADDHGTNGAYFTTRGSRRKSIRGNVYIQSRAHAAMIADMLMRQAETPRLSFRLSGCPGEPTRRLGQRITVLDTSTMSSYRTTLIAKVKWRLNDNGFSQDLECIDLSTLYPYLDASPGYFVVGTSELGSIDPQRGRVFF